VLIRLFCYKKISGARGRCAALNLKLKRFETVDCSNDEFLPLCELNKARKCMLVDGFYDGEQSETSMGEFFGFLSGRKCFST
jgi:hypothetical protein